MRLNRRGQLDERAQCLQFGQQSMTYRRFVFWKSVCKTKSCGSFLKGPWAEINPAISY